MPWYTSCVTVCSSTSYRGTCRKTNTYIVPGGEGGTGGDGGVGEGYNHPKSQGLPGTEGVANPCPSTENGEGGQRGADGERGGTGGSYGRRGAATRGSGAIFDTIKNVFTSSTFWTVPEGITSIDIVCVGGGGGGSYGVLDIPLNSSHGGGAGGGGGALSYVNEIAVTPGQQIEIRVGSGGNGGTSDTLLGGDGEASYVATIEGEILCNAGGGKGGSYTTDGTPALGGAGGIPLNTGGFGGDGGIGAYSDSYNSIGSGGGGGAGGYSGKGGNGGTTTLSVENPDYFPQSGSGGGGAGGSGGRGYGDNKIGGYGGGGVGLDGETASGNVSQEFVDGITFGPGGGGSTGTSGGSTAESELYGTGGGQFGGGGGGGVNGQFPDFNPEVTKVLNGGAGGPGGIQINYVSVTQQGATLGNPGGEPGNSIRGTNFIIDDGLLGGSRSYLKGPVLLSVV